MINAARIDLSDGLTGWDRGEGNTIVWLHGYTTNSSLWDEIWTRLPRFRHVGIDLPGHGASRSMRAGESLDDVATLVLDACRSVDARRLVGLSLGSLVALQAATMSPGDIDRLVLAAPAVGGMAIEPSLNKEIWTCYDCFAPGHPVEN